MHHGGAAGQRTTHSVAMGGLQLRAKPMLKAAEFEPRWRALPTVELWGATLAAEPHNGELQALLDAARFACMASGTVAGVSKYYFYAQDAAPPAEAGSPPGLCIVEVSVTLASLHVSLVIKATSAELGRHCLAAISGALLAAGKLPPGTAMPGVDRHDAI